jgi:hypothetical protein
MVRDRRALADLDLARTLMPFGSATNNSGVSPRRIIWAPTTPSYVLTLAFGEGSVGVALRGFAARLVGAGIANFCHKRFPIEASSPAIQSPLAAPNNDLALDGERGGRRRRPAPKRVGQRVVKTLKNPS